ncbi:MAG: CrcB family protein [Thermoleophilaceae bacterium]|nr:CrcB family protein [Thermoleophilaceae bacterium]
MNRPVALSTDARPGFAAECAAVFVGGFAGALARYGLVELLGSQGGDWPWPIFIANVTGCAILGYLIAHRGGGLEVSLIGTGFCGALTTFSTFQLEIYQLLDAHSYLTAVAYPVISIICGFFAVTSARRFVNRGKELA